MLHLPPKKIPRLFVKTFLAIKTVSDSDSDSDSDLIKDLSVCNQFEDFLED